MRIVDSPKPMFVAVYGLLFACIAATGCDKMAGKAMETALENSDSALPDSTFARLKAEKATCPLQINEHTVLKDVSLQGLDRIRYTYVVSESGRPEVNMLKTGTIRAAALERAKSSHLGPAIAKQKLGVDHFFEDADGKCLLWIEMTGKEYEDLAFVEPGSVQATNVSFSPQATEADREQMLAQLKDEQAQCPRQINSHTSLKSITLKGKNRIKYLYVVTQDGLQDVNMDQEEAVRQQVLDRTKETPLGKSIVKLDMGVEHFFQSLDGKCMLWLQMTRKDFTGESAPTAVETNESAAEEMDLTPPQQLESYIPDVKTPVFGNPTTSPGVQANPYVK